MTSFRRYTARSKRQVDLHTSSRFLAWRTLRPWRQRWYVPPKSRTRQLGWLPICLLIFCHTFDPTYSRNAKYGNTQFQFSGSKFIFDVFTTKNLKIYAHHIRHILSDCISICNNIRSSERIFMKCVAMEISNICRQTATQLKADNHETTIYTKTDMSYIMA
jgi:hypothetical protein